MITAHFTPNRLPDVIDNWNRQLEPEVLRALETIGEHAEHVARGLAPHGPTGNYGEGMAHTVNTADTSVTAGSRAPHAHLVERGRGPGRMPPPRKIAVLFGVSRPDAFPIARAISRGTEGAKVMELTARAMRSDVERIAVGVLVDVHRRTV